MFSKKNLIIISAIAILIILALYFFLQKKASQTANAPGEQSGLSSSPDSGQSSTPALSTMSDEDIRKIFTEFSSQKSAEPIKWLKFFDSQNRLIPLDRFTEAIGANINPQLKTLLDFNNYELFICNDAGKTNHGILMNIKLMSNYAGNLYQDEVKFMQAWESSLFQDTSKIIFPDLNFTRNQLKQNIIFKDGLSRHADVILPNNASGSIEYALVDDYVIIASSKECIKKASEYVFPTSN